MTHPQLSLLLFCSFLSVLSVLSALGLFFLLLFSLSANGACFLLPSLHSEPHIQKRAAAAVTYRNRQKKKRLGSPWQRPAHRRSDWLRGVNSLWKTVALSSDWLIQLSLKVCKLSVCGLRCVETKCTWRSGNLPRGRSHSLMQQLEIKNNKSVIK